MVKITSVVLAALAGLSVADNCKEGLDYCGKTLISLGRYEPQIIEALKARGYQNPTDWNIENGLFKCLGGENGDIRLRWTCKEDREFCLDMGRGKSDTCTPY